MKKVSKGWIVRILKLNGTTHLEYRISGTATEKPFTEAYRSGKLCNLVHSDFWGSMNVQDRGGYLYFTMFMDDFLRNRSAYLNFHKSEAL